MNDGLFQKPIPRETLYLDELDDRMVLVRGGKVPYGEWLEGERDEAYARGFWFAAKMCAFIAFMLVSLLWFGWAGNQLTKPIPPYAPPAYRELF